MSNVAPLRADTLLPWLWDIFWVLTNFSSTASKDFVLVRVGPDEDERLLPTSYVWNRPYFREPTGGIMYFETNDDDIYELSHPGLAEIMPEDFAYVAQYLESGIFGLQHPEGEMAVQNAFAESMAAWTAAEKLGMTDLMEHVVDKVERLAPWDMWDAMAFACIVYQTAGPFLPVQERMKDVLATDLAQHYWVYIQDDHLSDAFIQRLKDLPELERDILRRRTVALSARVDSNSEDEEEDEEDMDLYE